MEQSCTIKFCHSATKHSCVKTGCSLASAVDSSIVTRDGSYAYLSHRPRCGCQEKLCLIVALELVLANVIDQLYAYLALWMDDSC